MNDPSPLEAIFFAALEKGTPQERAAYLDEACAGDAELRRRVEKMLAAQDQAGSFLEKPARSAVVTVDFPITERPGSVIGPYKLLEQIGEGGFGVVFVAEQMQPVRRKVALKILKPGMDSRPIVARFEAERQALAIMDHPNIAKVHDGGATPSGRPYFVMELVKGVPITEFCDQKQLTPRQRLELFVSVCRAVQHAHQKGIIHRDLKPSNVLVTVHDTTPVVKVIDFGVAKAVGQELTDKTLYTGFAQMIGTPLYMSPEQAGQSGLDVDTRSDIYSLGVLLYELLTGTTPFTRERFQQATYEEIRRIIREEDPPRPSTRLSDSTDSLPSISALRQTDPAKLTRLVRGELDWIVMKAMEKDRNRRYETASGFARDIERYLHDEPVQACPPSAGYRLRKFVRRNRRALATGTLVSLLLLVTLGTLGGTTISRARERAARQHETERGVLQGVAQADAYLAQVDKQLDNPFRLQVTVTLAEGAALRAENLLAMGEGTSELKVRVGLLRDAVAAARRDSDLLVKLERILLETAAAVKEGNYDSARAAPQFAALLRDYGVDLAAPAAAALRLHKSRLRESLLAALQHWWRITKDPREKQQLEAVLKEAEPASDALQLRWLTAVKQRDVETLVHLATEEAVQQWPAVAIRALADDLQRAGQFPAAERLLRAAYARNPGDFWLNHDLGMVFRRQQPAQPEQAVRYLTAALALRNDSPGVYVNLGNALRTAGDVEGAIRAYEAALKIDPAYAKCYDNLGDVLKLRNDVDRAIRAYRRAFDLDPSLGSAHVGLGNVLFDAKDLDGAIREYQAALKIATNYAPAHYGLGNALRARAFRDKTDLAPAIAAFQTAIKYSSDHAAAHNNLGSLLWQQGRYADALVAFRAAIRLDPKLATAHYNMGNTLRDMKDLPGAVRAYQAAIRCDRNYASAHVSLGGVLREQGLLAAAVAEIQEAIMIDPNDFSAHHHLGDALRDINDLEGAARAYQAALKIRPNHAVVYWALGLVLGRAGHFTDALAALKTGQKLGFQHSGGPEATAQVFRDTEWLIENDARLVKIQHGEGRPANPHDRLQLATLCVEFKRLYATAAAWYAEAFAAEPKAADDLAAGYRYNAARAAVLAGSDRGRDTGKLTDDERAQLRRKALDWLRADLQINAKLSHGDNPQDRSQARKRLEKWLHDDDLMPIRDPIALAKLSAEERPAWVQLWADLEILLRKPGTAEKR